MASTRGVTKPGPINSEMYFRNKNLSYYGAKTCSSSNSTHSFRLDLFGVEVQETVSKVDHEVMQSFGRLISTP